MQAHLQPPTVSGTWAARRNDAKTMSNRKKQLLEVVQKLAAPRRRLPALVPPFEQSAGLGPLDRPGERSAGPSGPRFEPLCGETRDQSQRIEHELERQVGFRHRTRLGDALLGQVGREISRGMTHANGAFDLAFSKAGGQCAADS